MRWPFFERALDFVCSQPMRYRNVGTTKEGMRMHPLLICFLQSETCGTQLAKQVPAAVTENAELTFRNCRPVPAPMVFTLL